MNDRIQALRLIYETQQNGARKIKACQLLDLSLRTVERWEKPGGTQDKRENAKRKVPANKLTEQERDTLLTVTNSAQYRDCPPSKIVPHLADEGRYIASESTFYRVLRNAKQLTHRHPSKPRKHCKPTSLMATGPNQVWSWDITYLPITVLGHYFYLYLAMDIYSRKIVGWSIHEKQSSDHAAAFIKQACIDEGVCENQLVLHSDNGKSMKGVSMLAMLQSLGVMPSFSRPAVSDDNPFSESLFKTVKYHPTFPLTSRFHTIKEARVWMEAFARWYNTQHLHSGLKFITPHQRHAGFSKIIMEKRYHVYQMAKRQKPERWRGNTRNWNLPTSVTLNPERKIIDSMSNAMANSDNDSVAKSA